MKKRLKRLIAAIMVVVMFSGIASGELLVAIAAEITITADTTIDYVTEDNLYTQNFAGNITVTENGDVGGMIYGSGGETVIDNYGGIDTISRDGTTKINNYSQGNINTISCTPGINVINYGQIGSVNMRGRGVLNLKSGTVANITGTYTSNGYPIINAGGNATVGTLQGDFNLTGSGTINVTDTLNPNKGVQGYRINVDRQTVISAGVDVVVEVYYKNNMYTLTNVSGTLLELKGNTVNYSVIDEDTVRISETSVAATGLKYLKGEEVTVTYQAAEEYYFPADYTPSSDGAGEISVDVTDGKKAIVTYTVGNEENSSITVNIPEARMRGIHEAPTGITGKVCEVTGVTAAMEYAASPDAAVWTSCNPKNGVLAIEGGEWYFRYKETADKKAGPATGVKVKKAGVGSVSVLDIYYGDVPYPVASSTTNSTKNVKFEYKGKGTSDAAYSDTAPTGIGSYTVRATFTENDDYGAFSATADFSIGYLPAPEKAYTVSGTKGNNGYYTSNVTLTPAEGYWIASTLDGIYRDKLTIDERTVLDKVYLMKYSNGQKTAGINVNTFLIDTIHPVIDLENNKTYYAQSLEVSVYDKALMEVYVNDEKQKSQNGRFVISLTSENGKKEYEIKAVDYAGNETTAKVIVAAEWLETGIIPGGVNVNLETGNAYELDSGKWKVNGDDTCYNGGQKFYVGTQGDYVFEKQ